MDENTRTDTDEVHQSDSTETLRFEKSNRSTTNLETISSSSSSSIQPLDENSKLSELNLNNSMRQEQNVEALDERHEIEDKGQQPTLEKKDEILKENFLAENFQEFFQPLIHNLDSNVSTLRTR